MEKITDKTGRIAFIGGGMMAEAILKGMLHKEIAEPEMITISDPSARRREYLEKTYKVNTTGCNAEAVKTAGFVILAVKPQVADAAITKEVADAIPQNTTVLSIMGSQGDAGQFRTPRHIIKMMVEMMQPKADDVICDPACGTSGFLVTAGEYLKDNLKEEIFFNKQKKDHYMNHMFFGYDMDRTMLRIGAMNMMTHGVEHPFIEYRDSLSDQNPDKDKYSLILANPPFKGSLDYDTVSTDLLKVCKTKKTELLFLALFLRMLRIGGRCACIVPDGVLFGSSTAHKAIRKAIIEDNRLEAVISMPSGVFKPYAGVSTGILIFTKTGHGGTDKVWFYDMQADGFSLDDKRSEVKENDIPDIIARFHNFEAEDGRERTEKSFFVPKQEIVDNDYDLSINKYKKTEYVPVEYPSTAELMTDLHELEMEIQKGLAELEEMF